MKKNKLWKIITKFSTSVFVITCSMFLSPLFINNYHFNQKIKIKLGMPLIQEANTRPTSLVYNNSNQISYPEHINFLFESLESIMALPNKIHKNDLNKIKNFVDVARSVLSSDEWSSLSSKLTEKVSLAFLKLLNWYTNVVYINSNYIGPYPENERKLLSSEINKAFQLVNGITYTTLENAKEKELKFVFPKFKTKNIINKNYKQNSKEKMLNLKNFEYKVISINTSKLKNLNNIEPFTFHYGFQESDRSKKRKNYTIFILNKNNKLSNVSLTPEALMKEFNIFMREDNKNYSSKTTINTSVQVQNLKFVRNGQYLDVYINLKSQEEQAFISLDKDLSAKWDKIVDIGFLESTISPKNIRLLKNNSKTIIPKHTPANSVKRVYATKANWILSTEESNKQIITLYAIGPTSITLPIIYLGEEEFTSKNKEKDIRIVISKNGDVSISPKKLKISSHIYLKGIEPITILHKTQLYMGNQWTEIKIKSDENIVVGEADVLSYDPKKPLPAPLSLQSHNALDKPIFFEQPFNFIGEDTTKTIGYDKVVEEKEEVAKLLGEYYYSAWNFYPEAQKYEIVMPKNNIVINDVIVPNFKNNELKLKTKENWLILPKETPKIYKNKKLTPNGFGVLAEKLNQYANLLNNISQQITKEDLFVIDPINHYIPTNNVDAQKFALDRFITNNESKKTLQAIKEIAIALDIFFNGPSVLESDYKSSKNIVGLKGVIQNDKKALINFASSKITTIITEKQRIIYSNFLKKLNNYRFKILEKLLASNKSEYGNIFSGFHGGLISNQEMKIGSKNQNMQIIKNNKYTLKKYDNFQQQLTSIIKHLNNSSKIGNSLSNDDAQFLKNNLKILTNQPLLESKKGNILKTTKLLFIVIDNYASNNQNNGLLDLWTFKKYIANNKTLVKTIIKRFSLITEIINKAKKYYSSALDFTAKITDTQLVVANHNVQKIFDSMLNLKKWDYQAKQIIQKASNFNYKKDPNKLAEIAVKIRELNIQKFFEDITKNNILQVATKILKMDPLWEIPQKLPKTSWFANAIKPLANNMEIVLGISSGLLIMLGMLVMAISLLKKVTTKKSTLIIGIMFVSIGIITCAFAIGFASMGALSLLII